MIEPTTDVARINAVLNDPDIRPWIADWAVGDIDVAPLLAGGNAMCLSGEHGLFFLLRYDAGIYEVHTAVKRAGRGEWARAFAEHGALYMFCRTDAVDLITRVPEGHIAAKTLTEKMGFIPQFDTLPECSFRGQIVPVHIYSLPIQLWAPRQHWAIESGEQFHFWLNQQVGNGTPHEPDPGHNGVVGISMEMIRSGQVRKGVAWYNRAAIAARHKPIVLLSENPVRIKFDAGILCLTAQGIEFERVQ